MNTIKFDIHILIIIQKIVQKEILSLFSYPNIGFIIFYNKPLVDFSIVYHKLNLEVTGPKSIY